MKDPILVEDRVAMSFDVVRKWEWLTTNG